MSAQSVRAVGKGKHVARRHWLNPLPSRKTRRSANQSPGVLGFEQGHRFLLQVLCALFLLTLLTCGLPAAAQDGGGYEPDRSLSIIVPSNPGGGWDQTGRLVQLAMQQDEELSVPVEVVNRGGAGGTIGLSELVEAYGGDPDKLMVVGFGLTSATIMQNSEYSLLSAEPIARLTGDYQAIAVPSDSPFTTLRQLLDAFRETPRDISWGGGSAGGSDHVFIMQTALAMGITPQQVNYVAFTGGGEVNAALMGGQVMAGVSGYSELVPLVDSGRVRLLGISAPDRSLDSELPTLKESGVDIVFQNWRGLVAAPGLSPAEKQYLLDAVTRMAASKVWRDALERYGWTDAFMPGDDFKRFITQDTEKTATVIARTGLETNRKSAIIGPGFFPALAGAGILLCALMLFANHLRRVGQGAGSAVVSEKEDDAGGAASWRRFGLIATLFLVYLIGLETIGFLILTPIFIIAVSWLIGSRKILRDALIGIGLTGAVFILFDTILKVYVP